MSVRRAERAGVRGLAPALLLALAVAGCSGSKGGIRSAPPAAALDAAAGPEALVALADSAIAAADPELARRALVRASEIAPRSAAVHAGYGRYYTAILRYRDAKAELDKAAELDPTSPEPHYWLGVAYLKAGEKEQAFRSLSRALRLDPGHPGARAAVRPLLEERYRAAGVPGEYAAIAEHPTVTRGELGVMLAVELGVDPDRSVWRSDQVHRTDWASLDRAWGSRWLRASVARGWIGPLADVDLHLDDPVTRGALALLLAEIEARSPAPARADTAAFRTSARVGGGPGGERTNAIAAIMSPVSAERWCRMVGLSSEVPVDADEELVPPIPQWTVLDEAPEVHAVADEERDVLPRVELRL